MLHDPERHEALVEAPWDAAKARATIDAIVAGTERAYDPDRYWPRHPQDLEPGEAADGVTTPLYFGAAGVLWALRYLAARGFARPLAIEADAFETLLARNRDWLGPIAEREAASYLMGETPIRMLAFDVRPGDDAADALERLIAGNVDHPALELLWGATGTMLAALFLHEKTRDARWATLFRRSAQALWDRLEWSEDRACFFWTQDLYGRRSAYLGAGHGFAGAALPLIRGRYLLGPEAWSAWEARIVETTARTASREGGRANWDPQLAPPPGPRRRVVQWCHGAPGFVISLAGLPSTALDALLLEAGELIWHAGPLNKGSNLCHGTGGNGYAFLKLYRRTGDTRWLARARAFAMHGIAQTEAARVRHGCWRHSLWTGDIGFAIFLADCIEAEASFPTLDVFFAPTPDSAHTAIHA